MKKIFFYLICFYNILLSKEIKIISSPENVNVYTNDVKVGVTPVKINFSSPAELKLEKQGYKTFKILISTNEVSNKLFVRMLSTNSHFVFVKQLNCGYSPKDTIFSPDGRYIIISLLDENGIQLYDLKENKMIKIEIPEYGKRKGFVEGVFNRDGSEFWFNQMDTEGRVYVLNMKELKITHIIPTKGNWSKVGEFSPDYKYYYVTSWLSDEVSVIDAEKYSLITKFKTTSQEPRGVNFSLDGRYVYVVTYKGGEIIKYDISNNYTIVKRIKTGGTNGRFRIDYKRELAYINNMALSSIFVYDLKQDKIIKTIKTGTNPNNLKITPDGIYLFVSNRGPNNPKGYLYRSPIDGQIQIFDIEQDYKLVENLKVGNQPIGIAISPDGKLLAISNYMDHNIEIYEILL